MSTIAVRVNNPYAAAVLPLPADVSPSRRFRHNPYASAAGFESVFLGDDESAAGLGASRSESPAARVAEESADFEATLHRALMGHVNFEPFPQFSRASPLVRFDKTSCRRLFVGQIPYATPAAQVEWMVFAATGRRVYFTETIQRWTGSRAPKGCAHTYCLPEDAAHIVAHLHRRMLVDDSGVWIAADAAQVAALGEHCAAMKADHKLRFRDRPYQPVVVELATSDFVPRRATPPPAAAADAAAGAMPPHYQAFVHAEGFPALPAYEEAAAVLLPPAYGFF
jgi:hypothetical protein